MDTVMPELMPRDYPELARLLWNRDPERAIAPAEAFALYERNWRMVDAQRLTPGERALIEALTKRFGHGHFLG